MEPCCERDHDRDGECPWHPRGIRKYKLQVQVRILDNFDWLDVKPTHSNNPYLFNTREEAERMMRMCYPDHLDRVRVIETEP